MNSSASHATITLQELCGDSHWFPERIDSTTGRLTLVKIDRSNLSTPAFLADAWAPPKERGRTYHQALLGELCLDGREQRNWPIRKLLELSDLQVSALVWHTQISQFIRSLPLFEPRRVAALNCEEFLREPRAALQSISRFLQLGLDNDRIDAAVAGPLQAHAKDLSLPFRVDRRKEEEVARWLGIELDEVIHWSDEVCRTPQAVPTVSIVRAREEFAQNESPHQSASS